MKRVFVCLLCSFLLAAPLTAQAETTTETSATATTVTTAEGSTAGSTTETGATSTTATEVTTATTGSTTASGVQSFETSMILSFESGVLQVRVRDELGNGVKNGTVTANIDGVKFTSKTNENGVAEFAISGAPRAIMCEMNGFAVGGSRYEACAASVVLRAEPSTATTGSTTATATAEATSATRRPLTSSELTTTAPVETTTQTAAPTETAVAQVTTKTDGVRVPRGLSITLIAVGALCLIGAGVALFLLLVRRAPAEDTEALEDESIAVQQVSLSGEETAEATSDTEEAAPPAETPAEPAVSLEDLFRNK